MRTIVTGSLAYDYIMNFPGSFKDHILPDRAHMLTVSFLVDSMRRMRGGVAGNIAYTLALLGERPLVAATVGQDFDDYGAWMRNQGIDTSGIVRIDDEFTGSCFINNDQENNQIVAFYPGAMTRSRDISLEALGVGPRDIVIVSPTDPDAMARYTDECRRLGAQFLFDPGKQTPRLEAEQILAGIRGASVLVGNDYEFAMMAQKTGWSEVDLIASAPITVVTRGAQGSTLYVSGATADGAATNGHSSGQRVIEIPIAPVAEVVDPTGAGDAYLAGLVFGLSRGLPLEVTGRVAALAAAYPIAYRGGQEHFYTLEAFVARYAEVFGEPLEVDVLRDAHA